MEAAFAVAGAALWLIGGNIVVALHYRRRGLPWWSGLRPWAFPFREFDRREWAAIIALASAALLLLGLGITGPQ